MAPCKAEIVFGGGYEDSYSYSCDQQEGHEGSHYCEGDNALSKVRTQPFEIRWWDEVPLPRLSAAQR